MFRHIELSRHDREFTQDKLRRRTSIRSIHSAEDDSAEENDPTGAPSTPPSAPIQRRTKSVSSEVSIANHEDPLAEFYAQARAEHETGVRRCLQNSTLSAEVIIQWSGDGEGDDSDVTPSDAETEEPAPITVAKRVSDPRPSVILSIVV